MLRLISLLFLLSLPVPAAAQSFYTNSPLSCVRLPGLMTVLEKTVKETQIATIVGNRRLSQDVLRGQGDCTYVYGRRVVKQIFVGWLQTERWLVPLERVCFETSDPTWPDCQWRPADLLRQVDWTLSRRCVRRTRTEGGVTIYGHNFDGRSTCRPYLRSN